MFLSIDACLLKDFRKAHVANPWQVWALVCFLMVQSVFAVMDHHPVLEPLSQHFSQHLSDIDHHAAHGDGLDFGVLDFSHADDFSDEDHHCDSHFHGINLVALPYSALTLDIIPSTHKWSDLAVSVRATFPPPHYRPPIA